MKTRSTGGAGGTGAHAAHAAPAGQRSKKVLALLLTAAMTLTLLPLTAAPAYAEGVTGSLNIGGTTAVSDLTQNGSSTGWTWTASTATLTLDNSYTGYNIRIVCQSTDDITLVYASDIAITGAGSAVNCQGNLTISGSGGVLTLTGGSSGDGLTVEGALQISGGSVSVSGGYGGVYAKNGLTVSGAASLTANATGTNGNGLYTYDGDVVISTTGTVSAEGKGTGFAVNAMKSGVPATGLLDISGGTVTLTNSDTPANLMSCGLNHTGGTLNGYAAGTFPSGGAITTEADLISALQSGTASTITLGGNITLSTATVSMGASHTIETGGFTLTISGGENYSSGGRINLETHTLTLKGNAVIESVQGIRSANGTLNLENVTATLKIANSIYAGTVNVNSGATVNLNSSRSDGLGGSLLTLQNSTYSLNVNSGGVINIQDAFGVGINNFSSGKININSGGAINIGVIRNENWGVSLQGSGVLKLNSGGTLSGTAGGAIYLGDSTKVDGMSGKFIDRGTALTATGEVTVGAADATPSANGLSLGLYVWNGSAFVKAGGATTYTATLNIYRDNSPYSDSTAYTLKLDGNETTTVNMTGAPGATRTASVSNGTWKVYTYSNEYTGVNIVIAGAPGDAQLDQYTGSYAVNPQGAATGGTFSAVITGRDGGSYNFDFSQLPSSFYYKGDAVTFTATGEGASGYTYAWSGTHGGVPISGTGATYTIPSVTGTINLTCTITGSAAPPTISSVTVSPVAIEVQQGETQQFVATVVGANDPPQTVTWSVTGGTGSTAISASGLLTVDATQTTASVLTVRATSTADGTQYGEAAVTVTDANSDDNNNNTSLPQTGDNGNVLAWRVMLTAFASGFFCILMYRKRQSKELHH